MLSTFTFEYNTGNVLWSLFLVRGPLKNMALLGTEHFRIMWSSRSWYCNGIRCVLALVNLYRMSLFLTNCEHMHTVVQVAADMVPAYTDR